MTTLVNFIYKISYLLGSTEQVTGCSLSIFVVNNNYELTVYRIYTVHTTEISLLLISHWFNRHPFPKAGSKTRNALYLRRMRKKFHTGILFSPLKWPSIKDVH